MDTSKIIIGTVGGGRYTVTSPIVKEDYGLYLKIEGLELPQTYEVDFSNSEHNGTSVTMIGNSDGVLIPSQFISSGKDVFAFLYHVGVDFGRTVYKFRIPNKCRPDRTNEQPTPEEQSLIDQAIAALNDAVEQTAQDVIDADASAQASAKSAQASGESALSASNSALSSGEYASNALGYAESASASATASAQSAQSAKQSAQTASEKADAITGLTAQATTLPSGSSATASYSNGTLTLGIPRGADGRNGTDGTDGEDGISPTVTITPITGGHRITITDADGEHSADVMDGTGSVEDVQINGQSIVTDGVANIPMPKSITVTGTTPTITAQADTRYVCGEVATLDFTPSATGICDVVFTSGSTATVLTVPSTIKWANGFDPTSLDANTTYEINIMDGLGVAVGWT